MSEGISKEKTQKKERFVEKWAHAEEVSSFLGITLFCLIVLCVVLVIALFRVSTRPRAIYYIPGVEEAGVAYPNRITKISVINFASNWLLNRNNFTPQTVKGTYTRAMRYMAPELLAKTEASLQEEMSRVEHDNISSLFSLSKEPELNDSGKEYKVVLTGEKALFMGKEKLDSRLLVYTVTLGKTPAIETNPYGLLIAGVKQEEVREENQ